MREDALQVGECRAERIFADPNCAALFEEYRRECANPMLGAIAPQEHVYAALEASGMARCFGAYRNGSLVGFAFVLTTELPHCEPGRKFACVDKMFVALEARRSGLGERLMETIEGFAFNAGCELIFYSAPKGSRLAQMLFLYEDRYEHTNFIFTRRLR